MAMAAPETPNTSNASGVGAHYLRYSTANLLIMLASVVSFPILTRLLDNTQYGILGYYDTWLMLAVAIAKLGAQHAILRFYPFGGDATRLEHFATNLVLLPLLISLTLWALVALVLGGVHWLGGEDFSPVFWLALLAMPLMVFSSLVEMVFRASERSGLLMVTRVSWRWLELVLILGAVIGLQRSALAVYGGKLAAGVLVLAYYLRWVHRNLNFSRAALDLPAMRNSLRYGLPMVANEIAGVALISIDRVMLKGMTDDFATVGIYTIGYSLALQVNLIVHTALYDAFTPVANRLYSTGGATAVRELKGRILLPLTYAAVGIAAMLWGVGQEVLVALSGPGKAASGMVFVVVGMSYALYPLIDISGYGLLLQKRSMAVLGATLGAAALNITLNLMLIPTHGVMGAVWATVISYATLGATFCVLCPRDLLRFPDARSLTLAGICAMVLLAVIKGSDLFGVESIWLRLFIAGGLFVVLYAFPVWVLDRRLRESLLNWRRVVAV
jgi:O-antigen/teichoic acid export membrane protein